MAPIQRLKANAIVNGEIINADDINAELDQLVNTANSQDATLTELTGATQTLGGVKSFTNGIKTPTIAGLLPEAAVAINRINLSSTPASADLAEGDAWFHSTDKAHQVYLQGEQRVMGPLPRYWAAGPSPEYVSASQILLPKGLACLDDSGKTVLEITAGGGLTLSLSVSGAGGLDFGTEAANTFYYIWLCRGSSGTTAILSTSRTAPSLPTGYSSYKRRYPFLVLRNNGSSDIVPFRVHPVTREVFYPYADYQTGSLNDNVVMQSVSVGATPVTVSLASVVPPVSRWVTLLCNVSTASASSRLWVQEAGLSGGNAGQNMLWIKSGEAMVAAASLTTNASQQVTFYASASTSISTSAGVLSWIATDFD